MEESNAVEDAMRVEGTSLRGTVSLFTFPKVNNSAVVMEHSDLSLRKYTIKYLETKRRNVCNLFLNNLEKIKRDEKSLTERQFMTKCEQ